MTPRRLARALVGLALDWLFPPVRLVAVDSTPARAATSAASPAPAPPSPAGAGAPSVPAHWFADPGNEERPACGFAEFIGLAR